jgi:uncharacterized protein (TIGR03435 family)
MRGPYIHHGPIDVYEARDATMADLIAAAYGMDVNVVMGGPNWLEMDRFDVTARMAPKASKEELRGMLQALLAERFKLVAHIGTAPMPAWALTAGKHGGLKKSEGESGDQSGCKFVDTNGQSQQGPRAFTFECRKMTMAAFADALHGDIGGPQYLNDAPVVDQTGLEGEWDFNIHYTFRGQATANAADLITIFDAVDKQLGLKLELTKAPMPVILVASANRKPTENPPGTAEALHLAPATEFEVAEIKPTDPSTKGIKFNIQPSGQVNISGATLKFLMQQLWQIFPDEMFVGAPKWWNDDRWDIVAKPPAHAVVHQPGSTRTEVDFDTVIVMLKSLLAERFKLAAHMEDKDLTAYSLVSVKPRMKPADPNSRSRFTEGPATLDSKDPRNSSPILGRLLTAQNVSMELFGEKLKMLASGYIQSTVLDKTGLQGGWDFTLSFSTAGQLQNTGNGGSEGSDAAMASDPSGAVSLFEAVQRQMGLKLVSEKRPVPVLVIDHLEQKPTEN